ncbi:MAG: DoxX family protein [Saprospiraceae bacterium]|jgi:hypothetical protein|nr:DoxX family protein [Saprospiraceae bacterium]HRI33172.1 DoxX family protein [Saprospiraceae bacterium]
MTKKTKSIIGWVLSGFIAALFIFSAFGKLSGSAEVMEGFQKFGLNDTHRIGIGITELLCIILFLIPRTGVLGTLLLVGYMGGTIMAHFQGNLPITLNIIIAIVIGITAYIRFPELGSRLFGK